MRTTVDFYFDVACPYAYLAHTQVERIVGSAKLRWRPVLLGGLFRVIGAGDGPMPSMPASKAKLNLLDMRRWAEHWDVPLNMPATHPNRTVLAMRCILGANDVPRAAKALYEAYWVRGENVSDPAVVERSLNAANFDGAELVQGATDPALKQALRDRTDEAAAAGAFGVPTFVVRRGDSSRLIWGQDRLAFVAKAIAGELREDAA
jgi:2-hydroxychromene-2-carboxylate isomerase